MKKPYRNAIRSKEMIMEAFVALLAEKPVGRITVVELVERSGLSRNTFYAHYQDVYAVLEELHGQGIAAMAALLEEAVAARTFDHPLPFLKKVAQHVDDHRTTYLAVLKGGQPEVYLAQVKQLLMKCIIENFDQAGVRDRAGLLFFVEVLTAGFVEMFRKYLLGGTELTSEEIVQQTNRIFCSGVAAYR